MADLSILAGATSQSILVDLYILATGAPQTGLVYNSSGLTAYYSFVGVNSGSTVISLATQTTGTAWATGGFVKLSDTQMPGVYNFDVPNAVLAASKGREVWITFTGFAGMATRTIKIELTGWDNQVAVPSVNATQLAGQTITAAAGVTFPTSIASPTNITAGTITTVTNLTNAATAGDFTATMKTSMTTAATAATPTVLLTAGTGTGQVTLTSGILTANANGDLTATQKTSVTTACTASTPTAAAVTGSVGSVTAQVSANVTAVNGTTVNGSGTSGSPWGP